MLTVLSLIKNNKLIASCIGIIIICAAFYFGWNKIESSIYQEGYNDAVQVYQQQMIDQQNQYSKELEIKLKQLRTNLNRQHEQELARMKADNNVDNKVEEVIKYVTNTVEVPVECDTVPVDLNRMFNNSIRSINRSKEG